MKKMILGAVALMSMAIAHADIAVHMDVGLKRDGYLREISVDYIVDPNEITRVIVSDELEMEFMIEHIGEEENEIKLSLTLVNKNEDGSNEILSNRTIRTAFGQQAEIRINSTSDEEMLSLTVIAQQRDTELQAAE